MNRSDLVEIVSERVKVSKPKSEEIIDMIFGSMTAAMKSGDRIEIRGFGSFMVKDYGSYTGRNPRTGESIQVKPKKLPFFKVGKELRYRVDHNKMPPSSGDSEDDEGDLS